MEKTKSRTQTIVIASILVVLAVVILVGVYLQNQPRRLYPGEVREYMGENMSSLSDIRDNAIRGTQNINQSTYRLTVNGLVSNPKEYTYDQVVNGVENYEKGGRVYCVQGWKGKMVGE